MPRRTDVVEAKAWTIKPDNAETTATEFRLPLPSRRRGETFQSTDTDSPSTGGARPSAERPAQCHARTNEPCEVKTTTSIPYLSTISSLEVFNHSKRSSPRPLTLHYPSIISPPSHCRRRRRRPNSCTHLHTLITDGRIWKSPIERQAGETGVARGTLTRSDWCPDRHALDGGDRVRPWSGVFADGGIEQPLCLVRFTFVRSWGHFKSERSEQDGEFTLRWLRVVCGQRDGMFILVGKGTERHMPGNRTAWSDRRRRCAKQGDSHRTADRVYQTHRQARSHFPPVVPGTSMGGPSSPRLLPRRDWTHSLLGNTQLSSLVVQQVAVDRHSQSVRPNF